MYTHTHTLYLLLQSNTVVWIFHVQAGLDLHLHQFHHRFKRFVDFTGSQTHTKSMFTSYCNVLPLQNTHSMLCVMNQSLLACKQSFNTKEMFDSYPQCRRKDISWCTAHLSRSHYLPPWLNTPHSRSSCQVVHFAS